MGIDVFNFLLFLDLFGLVIFINLCLLALHDSGPIFLRGKRINDDDDSEEYGSITTVNSRRKLQPLVQDKVVAHGKKSRDKPNAE